MVFLVALTSLLATADPALTQVQWLGPKLTQTPTRIVSLAPSLTEIMCALDACERIVGVTRFDDYPKGIASKPKVGGFIDPDIEAVLRLKPHLIVAIPTSGGRARIDTMARLGVPVLILPALTLADLWTSIDALGQTLEKSRESSALRTALQTQLSQLKAALVNEKRLRALVILGHRPWVAAGPGSFFSEMLPAIHMQNALTTGSAFPLIDLEAVAASDPDVIIDISMNEGHPQNLSMYRDTIPNLRAVKHQRVVFTNDQALLRLAPRLIAAMAELSTRIRALPP